MGDDHLKFNIRLASRRPQSQRTKDEDLEILFSDKNQVDDKIAYWLGEGFLSFHSSFIS